MFRALAILLAAAAFDIAAAAENPPSGATLILRYGTQATLSEDAKQALYPKAVELLASSNFNSRAPRWEWNLLQTTEEYRQAVSGKYFLVTFKEPRRMNTTGGEVVVREILIGLNRPDYASSLHTIDDEGRIVGHGKYSGGLCIEFLKLVRKELPR